MSTSYSVQVITNYRMLANRNDVFYSDFNSTPQSGVIEYINRGRVSTTHHEFKHIGYKDCLLKMLSHSKNDQGENRCVLC